jgi:hypothetical protein
MKLLDLRTRQISWGVVHFSVLEAVIHSASYN